MTDKLIKYGGFNSYDLLKSIAVITMTIDHIGLFFYPDIVSFRVIGRFAYVLFAFCIGYNQKYRFDTSLFGLAILMLCCQLIIAPEEIKLFKTLQVSILFSIIIVRIFMHFIVPRLDATNLYLWLVGLILLDLPTYLLFQYGTSGVIMAVCGYLCATDKDNKRYPIFLATSLIFYVAFEALAFKFSLVISCALLPVFLTLVLLLLNFSIYPIKLPNLLNRILLFSSRNAMIIYFIQWELFKITKL